MKSLVNPIAHVGLLVFCGLLFFPGLGARDLTSSHEARAAQNAQMILDEGYWLVPQLFDRHLELQKPPLYYWLVAVLGWLNGGHVGAWAVRLPAALSALACVLYLYLLGIKCKRPLAGLLAALILASCLHFTWLARVGRIDMPLTMTITFALGGFYLGNREGAAKIRWHAFAYLSLGLGLLLKGPIAFVLPALVGSAAWCICDRRLHLRATSLWWGMPLMLAIAAPWYVWANAHTDNQLWEVFFWYHNVERGLGGSEVLKSYPWWYYLPQLAFDLLPWSVVLPRALWWFYRSKETRQDDAASLGLVWFAAIVLFLSCMSFKRADYLLPAYPGLAIFLGVCAERWLRGSDPEAEADKETWKHGDMELGNPAPAPNIALLPVSLSPRLLVSLSAGMLLYVAGWHVYNAAFFPSEETAWPYREMAQNIRRQTNGPVIFFRAESHPLMYHLGRPVDTILEWENLQWWTNRPQPVYVVMPEADANAWREHLDNGSLEEVLRTTDYVHGKRDRPLVVLRSRGRLIANQ